MQNIQNSINDISYTNEGPFLIWTGRDIKNFGIDFSRYYSFEKAIERVEDEELEMLGFKSNYEHFQTFFVAKSLPPKDEFETEAEFQRRKKRFELSENARRKVYEDKKRELKEKADRLKKEKLKEISEKINKLKGDILNAYLGKQEVEMKYNAEIERFDVFVKSRLFNFYFQIEIPRQIAREFKAKVKSFDFLCIYKNRNQKSTHKIKIGSKKVEVGKKKVQIGTKKVKVATRNIINLGGMFHLERDVYDDEPIYDYEPVFENQPLYREEIKEEKKVDFKIVKAHKLFKEQVFEAKMNFDIFLEELKHEIRTQYDNEFE